MVWTYMDLEISNGPLWFSQLQISATFLKLHASKGFLVSPAINKPFSARVDYEMFWLLYTIASMSSYINSNHQ